MWLCHCTRTPTTTSELTHTFHSHIAALKRFPVIIKNISQPVSVWALQQYSGLEGGGVILRNSLWNVWDLDPHSSLFSDDLVSLSPKPHCQSSLFESKLLLLELLLSLSLLIVREKFGSPTFGCVLAFSCKVGQGLTSLPQALNCCSASTSASSRVVLAVARSGENMGF